LVRAVLGPVAMIHRNVTVAAALASFLAVGCVTQGKYDVAVRDANTARADLATERARLHDAQKERAAMQKELDDSTAVDDQLQKELAKLGANARSLLADNGDLRGALEGSEHRLEELRRAQAAAEARAALYADLARKLKTMIDAGDLSVTLRDGRMVLRLSNDVLFDSGHAELKPAGKRALTEVATVLRTIPARQFQVAGHTDNEPIRFSPFRSNWELSTARALEVTGFLIGQGMDPHALSAAGYGEFDPVSDNDTALGKALNRRTEITLQPNIDEIVAVPEP
jgi:chemotaxis protein MotB